MLPINITMNTFEVVFNDVTFKFNKARNDFVTDSAFYNAKFTVIDSVFSKAIDSTGGTVFMSEKSIRIKRLIKSNPERNDAIKISLKFV